VRTSESRGTILTAQPTASLRVSMSAAGVLTLALSGRLDVRSTGILWRQAVGILADTSPTRVIIDASGLAHCDIAGIGLLVELQRR
jgi:ABC-type transporter Mla MlaB component